MEIKKDISTKERLDWKKDWHGWSLETEDWNNFHYIEQLLLENCFNWHEINLLSFQKHMIPEEPGVYEIVASTPQIGSFRKHELYFGESGKNIRSRFISHCNADKLANITLIRKTWGLHELTFRYTTINNWELYSDIKKFVKSIEWLYIEVLGPSGNREHSKKDIKEVSDYIEKEYYKVEKKLKLKGVA